MRRVLRFTGRLPTHCRLLYPLWLSAQLDLVEEVFSSPDVPEGLHGLVIGYASDIHYGPFLGPERTQDLAKRLNEMAADILLLGGDYGEDTRTAVRFFEDLPPLKARLGLYGVIGNHDHMGSDEAFRGLITLMREKGVTPLFNSAETLAVHGASLCLCAVDDMKEGEPDFDPLIAPASAADFTLFAPHSPDAWPLAQGRKDFRFHLTLAGHTHGGQITILGRALHSSSRYKNRYLSGWKEENGRRMLVSHGVGCSLIPVRLGARPQIHRLRLIRPADRSGEAQAGR